jgi:hypothetical protein
VSDRTAARLAWALLALALLCAATGLAISILIRDEPEFDVGLSGIVFPLLGIVPFSTVGALVAARQPRNPIAWLLLAMGLGIALSYATGALVELELARPGSVPAASWLAWLSSSLWLFTLLAIPQLLLRLPSGQLLSPRWRYTHALTIVAALALVTLALEPGPMADYPEFENPLGVPALDSVGAVVEPLGFAMFLALLLASALSIVLRFRRSRGIERLQLKWIAFAVATTAVLWTVSDLVPAGWAANLISGASIVALCSVPVSIGVAVLRYRLYDIDRVISKTLVYGALTVILGAAYVALVLACQAVFSSFAGGGDLAIAASTLVVAASFFPVRARVQRVVDRRFYRRRYDAQRTLEAFGGRLREQVELDGLRTDLEDVVAETMQPAHVSLWLREART